MLSHTSRIALPAQPVDATPPRSWIAWTKGSPKFQPIKKLPRGFVCSARSMDD